MLGPDAVSASTRLPAVQMDTRGQWVQTPVAQQLGLRDGQIVQATAEIRDQRVRLWVKDFFFASVFGGLDQPLFATRWSCHFLF